jgi:DNA-binding Lrp family transcriptional regulator
MRIKFIKLKCEAGRGYHAAERAIEIPEVTEIYTMPGDFDLLVKCCLSDNQDLAEFVIKTLQAIDGVKDTKTLDTDAWFV